MERHRGPGRQRIARAGSRDPVRRGELQHGRRRPAVHCHVDAPRTNAAQQVRCVRGGVAGERLRRLDVDRQGFERRLVARNGKREPIVPGFGVTQLELGVRIGAGNADHRPVFGERGPLVPRLGRVGQQFPDAFGRPRGIRRQRPEQPEPGRGPTVEGVHPPASVRVEQFDPVNRRQPVGPAQLGLRRIRMCRDSESAEAPHVLHDISRFARQRVRSLRQTEGDVVAAAGADLDGVDAEDALVIHGRLRRTRAVAVIGDDDEGEPGACGRRGDLLDVAAPVRDACVYVHRAAHGAVASPALERGPARREQDAPNGNGGREGRRCQNHTLHARATPSLPPAVRRPCRSAPT